MSGANNFANGLAKRGTMIVSNIEKLMSLRGISILKLSTETGLATRTLMRSRGPLICKCRLETLEKISRCLGVSTKDLYDELPDTAFYQDTCTLRPKCRAGHRRVQHSEELL